MIRPGSVPYVMLLAALLGACTGTLHLPASTPHYEGTAARVCSPVDAIGHELRLQRQSGAGPASVIITLWSTTAYSDGGRIILDGHYRRGQLSVCSSRQDCQPVARAQLVLAPTRGQGSMVGHFRSRSASLAGTFRARPTGDPVICG